MTQKTHPIIERVSRSHGIPVSEILGKSRKMRVARARFLCVYVLRQSGWTWQGIGKLLGGRDHSTIISAYKRVVADPALTLEGDHLITFDLGGRFTIESEIKYLKQRLNELEKMKGVEI